MAITENAIAIREAASISNLKCANELIKELKEITANNESTQFDFAERLYAASISPSFIAEMQKVDKTENGEKVLDKNGNAVKWSKNEVAKYFVECFGISKTMAYDSIRLGKYIVTVDNEFERRKNPKAKSRTRRRYNLVWNSSEVKVFALDENGVPIINQLTGAAKVSEVYHEYDFDNVKEYSFAAALFLSAFDSIVITKLHKDGVIQPTMSVRDLKEIMVPYKGAKVDPNTAEIVYSPEVEAKRKEQAEKERIKQAEKALKEEQHKILVPVDYVLNDIEYHAEIPLDILLEYTKKKEQ